MENTNTKRRTIIAAILLLVATIFWGSAFVSQDIGARFVGTLTFTALRSWIAVAFLFPFSYFNDKRRMKKDPSFDPSKEDKGVLIKGGAILGVVLLCATATQQAGIPYTTSAEAGFLTTLYVVFTPILSIFFGYRLKKRFLFCILLSLLGMYLLCMSGGKFHLGIGDILMIICAFFFALQIIFNGKYSPKTDPIKLTAVQFLVIAIIATVLMFAVERPSGADIMKALPAILYTGFFSNCIAYTLQIVSQGMMPPQTASIIMTMESVFSSIFGFIFLHQVLSPIQILGCVLMFASMIISVLI